MRLDRFLDLVCLFKTRSAAARAIDGGRVRVGGAPAKRSHDVAPGDVVDIDELGRSRSVEVLDVPSGSVSKRDQDRYVRVIRDEPAPRT